MFTPAIKPTERDLAVTVANIRQGESSTPRCEPPGEADIEIARAWVARILRAQAYFLSPASSGQGEAVAWTGSGSLAAVAGGLDGYMWPDKADAHPIPLYLAPATPAPVEPQGRDFWLHYDHQTGKWCVENEPPKVIRTGSEIIHTREVGPTAPVEPEIEGLVERLREGVKVEDVTADGMELYDIDDAETAMAEAASALTRMAGELREARASASISDALCKGNEDLLREMTQERAALISQRDHYRSAEVTWAAEVERLTGERDRATERADSIEQSGLSNCCREDGGEPCSPFVELEREKIAAEASLAEANALAVEAKGSVAEARDFIIRSTSRTRLRDGRSDLNSALHRLSVATNRLAALGREGEGE